MIVKVTHPFEESKWDAFVKKEKGTVFHTSLWGKILRDTYRFIPYYFILEDEKKEILAGIPFFLVQNLKGDKKLVSLPFTDEVYPLGKKEFIEEIIEEVKEISRKENIKSIEIRGGTGYKDFDSITQYKIFKIDLTMGKEEVWKRLKPKSVRYPVKKAQKMGIKVEIRRDKEAIKEFYYLNLLTRKKHGVFPQPYRFFENVWKYLIKEGYGFVALANYEGKIIAGSVFFEYGDNIYYKFNASDATYRRTGANHFILWKVVEYACEKGKKCFDFGRTSVENRGLLDFKKHWGGEERDLSYYFYPPGKFTGIKESGLKYRIITGILRRFPLWALKAGGEIFYKYLG